MGPGLLYSGCAGAVLAGAELVGDMDEMIRLLNQQGWAVSDTVVSPAWLDSLSAQARTRWEAGGFQAGEIGHGAADGRHPEIRGDFICWVGVDSDDAKHPFFQWMTQFRAQLNEAYSMGLRSQEFHYARYDKGRGYKKHIDQHRGTNYRKISVVLYLNTHWDPANGGELCLYQPYDPEQEMLRIVPLGARLVIFVSGAIPHAVLPCRQPRWSLAGWLRTDDQAPGAA